MKKNKKWQLWTEIKTGSVESYTSKTQTQKPTAEGSVTRCKTQTVFCSILCSTLGYSLNLYLIKLRWFSDSTNVRPFFYPSTPRTLLLSPSFAILLWQMPSSVPPFHVQRLLFLLLLSNAPELPRYLRCWIYWIVSQFTLFPNFTIEQWFWFSVFFGNTNYCVCSTCLHGLTKSDRILRFKRGTSTVLVPQN